MSMKFKIGDKVVYPAHGLGKVISFRKEEIVGIKMESLEILFIEDELTIQIPKSRIEASGLRLLCSDVDLVKARKTLRGKVRIGRGMWSKRAKDYDTKINSGSISLLAEVVRDLHKNVNDPDRSYSERIIYENALNRLAREFAAVDECDEEKSKHDILDVISVHGKDKIEVNVTPIADDFGEFEEFDAEECEDKIKEDEDKE